MTSTPQPSGAASATSGTSEGPAEIFAFNEAKLVSGLGWAAAAALLVGFAVGNISIRVHPIETVAFMVALVCFLATPGVVRLTGKVPYGAMLLLFGAMGPIFVPAWFQEGIRSPYLLWFVVIPMLAPLYLGIRFSLVAMSIGLVGFSVLYLRSFDIADSAMGTPVPAFFYVFNLALASIFGALVGIATRRSNIRIRRDLDSLEEELRGKAAALEESSVRRKAILDSSRVAIVSCDERGAVTGFNPAAVAIFGHSRDEAMGRPVKDLIVSESLREKHEAGFARYLETGRGVILGRALPLVGCCADGTEIPVEVMVQKIDLPGAPQFTAFIRDLRSQRQSEALLRQREQQLQKARRLEDVGRLAGGVAHDFNNLLTIITGYSETITDSAAADSTIREDALEIANAAERASAITNQLLAFSRAQVLELGAVDLSRTLRDFESTLRAITPPGLDFRVSLETARWQVRADVGQFERLVMNLVLNACDALETGGRLDLSLSYIDEPRRVAQLVLRDEGAGMDAETLSHAFEPFFTTKDVGKGTGLGLATVYGIVQQFEGTIQIESEAGQGTSVSVQLPEFVSAAPGDAAIVRPEGGPTRTIVVVDDDPQVCAVVAARLRLDAYRVLEATDGEEALRILEREGSEVDLVISDLIMPIKSGPELVAEIAAQHPRVKFILMSGYLSSEAAGVETGDQQTVFLRKPVRMEELSETVRGVLAGAD